MTKPAAEAKNGKPTKQPEMVEMPKETPDDDGNDFEFVEDSFEEIGD